MKKGDIVVEAGAGVGAFVLTAAHKASKVIAIEPAPHVLKYLQMNTGHLENVYIIEKAVWNCRGTVTLHRVRLGGSTLVSSSEKEVSVQADTLDNIIAEVGIKKVDILRMNIEGAEIEALEGANQTLHLTDKALVVGHMRSGKSTTTWVSRFLEDRGFTIQVKQNRQIVYAWKNR